MSLGLMLILSFQTGMDLMLGGKKRSKCSSIIKLCSSFQPRLILGQKVKPFTLIMVLATATALAGLSNQAILTGIRGLLGRCAGKLMTVLAALSIGVS